MKKLLLSFFALSTLTTTMAGPPSPPLQSAKYDIVFVEFTKDVGSHRDEWTGERSRIIRKGTAAIKYEEKEESDDHVTFKNILWSAENSTRPDYFGKSANTKQYLKYFCKGLNPNFHLSDFQTTEIMQKDGRNLEFYLDVSLSLHTFVHTRSHPFGKGDMYLTFNAITEITCSR